MPNTPLPPLPAGLAASAASRYAQCLEAAMQLARYVLKQSDPALAARYRALGDLPEGPLGHAYIQFIESNGFSVPGEPGGPPPPIARHDCMHVLGGYGTSSAEEGVRLAGK